MDNNEIGKAISYLRKRAGYTQKDLADRIGISDKAVSKWERGLGLPDIGYLRKLSILLDTDTDSLLAGDVIHHDRNWTGIILLEDNAYKIGTYTIIYDKPLIYFLLSYFLLVGIRDIIVVGTEEDKRYIEETLGDGQPYGIRLNAIVGGLKDIRIEHGNIMLVYGHCLLYGVDQTRFFQKAMMERDHFTVLSLPGNNISPTNRIAIDINKKIVSKDSDKALIAQYDFVDTSFLFFPSSFFPAIANKDNIANFVKEYATDNEVYVQRLDRGFVEIQMKDWNDVQEASIFLKIVQEKCGMNVYCLEEVAWRRGFISLDQMKRLAEKYTGTEYGDYILGLYEKKKIKPLSD